MREGISRKRRVGRSLLDRQPWSVRPDSDEETLLSPVKGNSIKPGVTNGNPWSGLKEILEPIKWATDCAGTTRHEGNDSVSAAFIGFESHLSPTSWALISSWNRSRGSGDKEQRFHRPALCYRPHTWAKNERASWLCPTVLLKRRLVERNIEDSAVLPLRIH
jgi:hypothetical protein